MLEPSPVEKHNMNLGTICYLPPVNIGFPRAFLRNLQTYKHTYPILFYSDISWPEIKDVQKINSPRALLSKPEWWKIASQLFSEGIRLAHQRHFDYVILLESDCRVKYNCWDKIIFDEFFANNKTPLVGGTFFCHNIYNESFERSRAFELWRHSYPVPDQHPTVLTYGTLGAVNHGEAQVWPNGALAVVHVPTMARYFPLPRMAPFITAYDVSIGLELRKEFGLEMFQHMRPMESTFSYYGDLLFNEPQRLAMLGERCVAVHAIKSNI